MAKFPTKSRTAVSSRVVRLVIDPMKETAPESSLPCMVFSTPMKDRVEDNDTGRRLRRFPIKESAPVKFLRD